MKNDHIYQDNLKKLRHSTAHLLAAAVLEIWPNAKTSIGPAIDEGFYYDFDFGNEQISDKDFVKIEKKMRQIMTSWKEFVRSEVSAKEALNMFSDNMYKKELIQDLEKDNQIISIYTSGNFSDLCMGGHVDNPDQVLGHFKLLSTAGAYWRGDEKNKMLTRIYGTAFYSQEELEKHLLMLEEAKLRDHRRIGKEMELFFIDEVVGKGLVMWLPNGTIIRDQIENFAKQQEQKAGYQRVVTPHIAKDELFLKSGHLPYYEKDMYPAMQMDDGKYYLKAMNCPHHHRIFQHSPKSYKDLPLRLAEYGTCYRNELSGTLAGLLRVRGMAMNDAHIYCSKDQIQSEFEGVLRLVMDYFAVFGLNDYWFRLSKWDPQHTDKYINEPENWEYSQDVIRQVLLKMELPFVEADDEAAFYGPKVDVQFKSVIGREETMSTIQLDFMAKTRFGLSYTDANGEKNNDVFVIHRAPLSVHERFLAFVIEHFAGKFPLWLAPVQIKILPISNQKHLEWSRSIATKLQQHGLRVGVDDRSLRLQAKIRNSQLIDKVPYMLIVGDQEVASQSVTVRDRDNNQNMLPLQEFLDKVIVEVEQRKL